eukprot:2598675-Heterocapsa_arctica.AAC.1
MAHTSSRHPTIAKGANNRRRDHWRDQRRKFVESVKARSVTIPIGRLIFQRESRRVRRWRWEIT